MAAVVVEEGGRGVDGVSGADGGVASGDGNGDRIDEVADGDGVGAGACAAAAEFRGLGQGCLAAVATDDDLDGKLIEGIVISQSN